MAHIDLGIRDSDKQWLAKEYSSLKINANKEGLLEINGDLMFDMVFYGKDKKPPYVIKPNQQHLSEGTHIQGNYQIKIILEKGKYSNLPQVFETGSKIESACQKWKSNKKDLHIYDDDVCCLCMRIGENSNFTNVFNLPEFFNNLVIPFFYAQSYFSDKGEWPWGDYKHGIFGVFEWYLEKDNLSEEEKMDFISCLKGDAKWPLIRGLLLSNRVRMDSKCICGGKKIKSCHSYVLRALWKLTKDKSNFPDLFTI